MFYVYFLVFSYFAGSFLLIIWLLHYTELVFWHLLQEHIFLLCSYLSKGLNS